MPHSANERVSHDPGDKLFMRMCRMTMIKLLCSFEPPEIVEVLSSLFLPVISEMLLDNDDSISLSVERISADALANYRLQAVKQPESVENRDQILILGRIPTSCKM